jgi:hypothetical protein
MFGSGLNHAPSELFEKNLRRISEFPKYAALPLRVLSIAVRQMAAVGSANQGLTNSTRIRWRLLAYLSPKSGNRKTIG